MKKERRSSQAIVYMATNKVNGKRYIGVTTHPLPLRAAQHFSTAKGSRSKAIFHKAIRKYGDDAFEFSILLVCETGLDAFQEEVRLIAELRPEYNSTLGGEGSAGRGISSSGRARISKANTGNKYRLGSKHTQKTKEAVRIAQLRPIIKMAWSERARLGPKALSKRVLCLDDGREFPSASAAAREYGVDKSALIELCLGQRYRKSVGGRRFAYMEAY